MDTRKDIRKSGKKVNSKIKGWPIVVYLWMFGMTFLLNYIGLFFLFNREGKNVLEHSVLRNCWQKIMRNNKNNATLMKVQPKFSPGVSENEGKII